MLKFKIIAIAALYFGYACCKAQNVNALIKKLEKKQFKEVKEKLDKYISKGKKEPVIFYFYSKYFFDNNNQKNRSLDSAYANIEVAFKELQLLDSNEREKYQKAEIGEKAFEDLKSKILSEAFLKAKEESTEPSLNHFITFYNSDSSLHKRAIQMRDSISYHLSQLENSYQSYLTFLSKYPDAAQAKNAKYLYEKLLYEAKTKSSEIDDLVSFINSYPESPYRVDAEKRLYYKFTFDNQKETFEQFAEKFPDNSMSLKAWLWLWFLTKEKDSFFSKYPKMPNREIFVNRLSTDTLIFLPIVKNNLFGFIDLEGNTRIKPSIQNIPATQKCKPINEEYIIAETEGGLSIFTKKGEKISASEFDRIKDFSEATFCTKKGNKFGLFHKGGFELIPPKYDSLLFLYQGVVAAKSNRKWRLITMRDSVIVDSSCTSIKPIKKDLWILERDSLKTFLDKRVFSITQNAENSFDFLYEELSLSHENFFQVLRKNKWGVISRNSREIIPIDYSYIEESSYGWIVEKDSVYYAYDLKGNLVLPEPLENVLVGDNHYAIKKESKWGLVDLKGETILPVKCEELNFLGKSHILIKEKNKYHIISLQNPEKLVSIHNFWQVAYSKTSNREDPATFIITRSKRNKKGLMDLSGKKLLHDHYDDLQLVQDSLCIFKKHNKKGVLKVTGEVLLHAKYDGISETSGQSLSLYLKNKFGLFNTQTKKTIPAYYAFVPKKYGKRDSLFIAKKQKFGIIDSSDEELIPFVYDEIKYWNDTIALVQKANKWQFLLLNQKQLLPDTFDHYELLFKNNDEVAIKTFNASGYGLISSRFGRIIPEEYNEILNISNTNIPIYLVQKTDRLTHSHLILYVSNKGKVIYKQFLSDEEFQKFSCFSKP